MDLSSNCNSVHCDFHHGYAAERLYVQPQKGMSPPVPSKIFVSTVWRKPSAGTIGKDTSEVGRSGARPRHQSTRGLAPGIHHVASCGGAAHYGHHSGNAGSRNPS